MLTKLLKNKTQQKIKREKTKNIYNEFPEIAKKIEILADIKRKEIGDDLTKVNGTENRPIGMID